jgi:hypothetical protein
MRVHHAKRLCTFPVVLLLAQPLIAFRSPLSDESLRQAYFAGQRHDGSFERLLESHSHHFAPPKTGPYISSVIFVTPFMMAAELSNKQLGNYSAQQAAVDHRNAGEETVRVTVEIQFTDSYGQFISNGPANTRSGASAALIERSGDFWKDFEVQIFSGEQALQASTTHGSPNYRCNENGGCSLIGATLQYVLLAHAFLSDTASITVTPPEGEAVTAAFDLSRLR